LGRARLGVAAALVALALPSSAAAEITRTPAVRAVFTLERNGVLDVLERLSVAADAPTPTTWQITMQRGELFAQPSLFVDGRRYRPGDGKRPGTFRISRGSRGVRFDWLQPPGTHTVRLGYRLALFGTAYTDVVDLHVPLWESGWPVEVGALSAALELPRVPRRNAIVWLEPRRTADLSTTGRAIRVRTGDIGAGESLTLRAVLPRSVVSAADGLNVETKAGLAKILAERRSNRRTWWPWIVAASAVAVLSAAVVLRTARSRRPPPR
jgi:Predicted membrane protein (DUF2207)